MYGALDLCLKNRSSAVCPFRASALNDRTFYTKPIENVAVFAFSARLLEIIDCLVATEYHNAEIMLLCVAFFCCRLVWIIFRR